MFIHWYSLLQWALVIVVVVIVVVVAAVVVAVAIVVVVAVVIVVVAAAAAVAIVLLLATVLAADDKLAVARMWHPHHTTVGKGPGGPPPTQGPLFGSWSLPCAIIPPTRDDSYASLTQFTTFDHYNHITWEKKLARQSAVVGNHSVS